MASLLITRGWLDSIKNPLANVASSGQAWAALDEALAFAADVSDAVKEGGSWFSSDPWRDAAVADVDNAATQVRKEKAAYSAGSDTPVDKTAWAKSSQKALYLYSLAEVTRQGYPPGEDAGGIESVMLAASTKLTAAILEAPVAVVKWAAGTTGKIVEAVSDVGKKTVKAAGGIVRATAEEAKGVIEGVIPWTPIFLGFVGVVGVVGLVVWLSKSGALSNVAKLKGL